MQRQIQFFLRSDTKASYLDANMNHVSSEYGDKSSRCSGLAGNDFKMILMLKSTEEF